MYNNAWIIILQFILLQCLCEICTFTLLLLSVWLVTLCLSPLDQVRIGSFLLLGKFCFVIITNITKRIIIILYIITRRYPYYYVFNMYKYFLLLNHEQLLSLSHFVSESFSHLFQRAKLRLIMWMVSVAWQATRTTRINQRIIKRGVVTVWEEGQRFRPRNHFSTTWTLFIGIAERTTTN